uniref:Uncharacterized protein n=1 Tax=Rhizophora mucronata TaxID=61149 RepID=A0A2P2QL04_RHIMU
MNLILLGNLLPNCCYQFLNKWNSSGKKKTTFSGFIHILSQVTYSLYKFKVSFCHNSP